MPQMIDTYRVVNQTSTSIPDDLDPETDTIVCYYLGVEQDADTPGTGQEGKLAYWNPTNGWTFFTPQNGDEMFDADEGAATASPAKYVWSGGGWSRMNARGLLAIGLSANFAPTGSPASLDGTYRQIDVWNSSAINVTPHTFLHNNDGTGANNGVFLCRNRSLRLVEILCVVLFGMDQTTQATTNCSARLEISTNGGSSWNAIDASEQGETVFKSDTGDRASCTLAARTSMGAGDLLRVVAKRDNGTATCSVRAAGTRLDICEVVGV